jgi:methylated-DNA-[protein]-cysteine S-methyltransferase
VIILQIWSYPTPWGEVVLESDGSMLVHVYLPGRSVPAGRMICEDSVLKEAGKQLQEYLDKKRKQFDLPIRLEGTPFMLSVWHYLQTIPYGQTVTYREIAEYLQRPLAFRAVGMANGRNPLAIFVPCHRVVGSDGSLTGFGGGLPMKEGLLTLEKSTSA